MKQLWLYATFRYPVSKYNELHVANIPHCHRFRSVWNAKKENCKILQPVAAAAVVGRIDKSQKIQLFVVVAPFVNVVFVVANYAQQQQQKKSPIRTEGGRACAARPALGRRAVCAAHATTTFVPYFCTWLKGGREWHVVNCCSSIYNCNSLWLLSTGARLVTLLQAQDLDSGSRRRHTGAWSRSTPSPCAVTPAALVAFWFSAILPFQFLCFNFANGGLVIAYSSIANFRLSTDNNSLNKSKRICRHVVVMI